ncbi:hypothetical protein Tco_0554530 [Tanacetum coccineum]
MVTAAVAGGGDSQSDEDDEVVMGLQSWRWRWFVVMRGDRSGGSVVVDDDDADSGVVDIGGGDGGRWQRREEVAMVVWRSGEWWCAGCGWRPTVGMAGVWPEKRERKESIDNGFARFNTTITSLKALDEGFSRKNYVRKFIRVLHLKWRVKVTAIEESKDLSSLALDELIGNLNVHKVIMEKDSEIYKGKKERVKFISLKAKKESSDGETSISESDDE